MARPNGLPGMLCTVKCSMRIYLQRTFIRMRDAGMPADSSRRAPACFPREQLQYGGPAAVDALSHRLSVRRSHALEVAMLDLDPGRARRLGNELHLDLGRECDAG